LIAVIIIFSQFCINLTDFKFNILLDQFHPDRADKVRYLGSFYSYIGMISFTVQILLIPLVLKRLQLSSIHRFIPICYLVVILLGFGLGGHLFLPVAASFALFKGVDYSLFAAAKELLYFPLSERQKYGAKYICDMLIYRMAKGLISFILIFVQAPFAINMMLFSCLVLWIIGLGPIFKMREKLLNVQEKL
jgi:AAA family ATP:ADP antiporter